MRDEWDNKKAELEAQMSKMLGETWTFDVNPLAIYPYTEAGSYDKAILGNCIFEYV